MHTTMRHVLQLEFVEAFDLVYLVARWWRGANAAHCPCLCGYIDRSLQGLLKMLNLPNQWRRWPTVADAPAGADRRRWLVNLLVAMLLLAPMATDGC